MWKKNDMHFTWKKKKKKKKSIHFMRKNEECFMWEKKNGENFMWKSLIKKIKLYVKQKVRHVK